MFKCKVYKLQDLLWTSSVFFGIKYSHHFRSFVSKAMTLLSAFPAKRMVTCISARKSSVQQNLPFLRAMESVSFNVTSVSTSVMWCGSCNTCEKWFRQQWSCSKTKASHWVWFRPSPYNNAGTLVVPPSNSISFSCSCCFVPLSSSSLAQSSPLSCSIFRFLKG